MSLRLGLWLLLALAGWGFAFLVYRRRELPVRAVGWLAFLRGSTLALVVLLLLDFSLPGGSGSLPSWTLLDVSASMGVPQEDGGGTALDRAREQVESRAANERLLLFGTPLRNLPDEGALPAVSDATDSRLAPALIRALEGGASRIRVLTDLRITDPVETAAILASATVPVEVVDVGGPVVNAGVAELEFPAAARAGEVVEGEVVLFGEGGGEAELQVTRGGTTVLDTLVTLPGTGVVRVPVSFQAGEASGSLPITARILVPGDAHSRDDVRIRALEVDPEEGILVLVSWIPDWEPRFLLPVLEEVTGLPARGYLRIGEQGFLPMDGSGTLRGLEDVAAELEEARIAVVHGLPQEPPPELVRAVDRSPRLIRLAGGAGSNAQGGEWYVSPEIPPSPLAGELAGVPVLGLPPLTARRTSLSEGGTPVLSVQLGGSGEPVPLLTLHQAPAGRRVESWASGFWRWGFREGAPRDVYRRLWSGATGWLLSGDGGPVREVGLAPVQGVVASGEAVAWRAGPAAAGSVRLHLVPEAIPGAGEGDGHVLAVDSLGRTTSPALSAAGWYGWRMEVVEGPGEGGSREGILVVEDEAVDLLPPRAVSLLEGVGEGEGARAGGPGRPLRTHPFPYILLVGLLAAEWVGRRRSGLR